jgi:predicted DNA-binding WGR domain protein
MLRLELQRAATPDRPGTNPFTKQPVVIKGLPAIVVFAELDLEGTALTSRWGELRADTREPIGEPQESVDRFDSREEAEACLAKYAAEYRADGYEDASR